ncbi:ATP-binding protein [Sporolituus thermophilus]|uniref:histidine kinase n=1 Tax=Sporolituus thermophilus DSM 23256 TaxID=1123285 RepID=A0A1G7J699_9FIRM|nr:ATP-binding protein [Sporolituus thermophilus]SDF20314.1 Histidine kinase-, DNA gyrase B-, and HSP90-like ATPase [Sporolituus thermophilus DSM 23256]
MRDLSLHILDLVQNSIEAGASAVEVSIIEDAEHDLLALQVSDNGRGMDETMRRQATDPFVTSRTTRRVGLGLPLAEMTARRTGGYLTIDSQPGRGTMIKAVYGRSHWDRPPLGDIAGTVLAIIVANPDLDFSYRHKVGEREFTLVTRELKAVLDGVPFSHPEVLAWLKEYLREGLANLYGGVTDENH